MNDINKRMVELRKACKLNQSQFAQILGLSRSGVCAIETGRRTVTDKHLLMIEHWNVYNVNIDWLRTGTGEMFLPSETNALEEIRQQYNLTDMQFRFISNFLRLPEAEKNTMLNFYSSVCGSNVPQENV